MKLRVIKVVLIAAMGLMGGLAHGQSSDLAVTLGLKTWANKWTGWDYYAPMALDCDSRAARRDGELHEQEYLVLDSRDLRALPRSAVLRQLLRPAVL